jgi:hypothetical protein
MILKVRFLLRSKLCAKSSPIRRTNWWILTLPLVLPGG